MIILSDSGTKYILFGSGSDSISVQLFGTYFQKTYAYLQPDGKYFLYPNTFFTINNFKNEHKKTNINEG